MDKYRRIHPFSIIDFLSAFSPVFLFTVLRRIFAQPQSVTELILYNGIDILILTAIITLTIFKYRYNVYRYKDGKFQICRGLFFRSEYTLRRKNIAVISVSGSPLQRIFYSRELRFFTPGVKKGEKRFKIFLSVSEKNKLIKSIINENFEKSFNCRLIYLILMMITSSDTISGILLFSFSLRRAGKILGDEYAGFLYGQIDPAHYIIALGAKPLTAAIAGIMISALMFTLTYRLLTYGNFSLSESKNSILCKRGILWKYETFVQKSDILFFIVEQSFIMRVFKCASVKYAASCISSIKSDRNIIIPADSEKRCESFISSVVIKGAEKIKIKPPQRAAIMFAALPLSVLAATILLYFALFWFNAALEITTELFYAAVAIELFWLIFRLDLPNRTGIILYDNIISVRCFRRFKIIRAEIPIKTLTGVLIEQNIFQKSNNRFHLSLYVNMHRFRIKHLCAEASVINILEKLL